MEFFIFTIILAVSYLLGSFAFPAIIFPFTNVIPRFLKENTRVPTVVFFAPLFWIIALLIVYKFGLSRLENYKYALYIGFGIPFILTLIKSVRGGEDLEADIQDTYGRLLQNDNSKNPVKSETIESLNEYINKLTDSDEVLIICFNKSSDFINIKKDKNNHILSFPLISDRMKSKESKIVEFIKNKDIEILKKDDKGIRVMLNSNSILSLKNMLIQIFELTNQSDVEYEIR